MISSFKIPLNGCSDEIDGSAKQNSNLDQSTATKYETPTKDPINIAGISQTSPSTLQIDQTNGAFMNFSNSELFTPDQFSNTTPTVPLSLISSVSNS